MTEEEFKQTVMPHHQMMLAEALRLLRNRDDALDCLQDAITSLWETRKLLHEVENIRAYCLRTVANKALEMLRRQAGDASGPPAAASEEEPPDAALERSERAALLKKAIMQLPDNERKIVVMSDKGNDRRGNRGCHRAIAFKCEGASAPRATTTQRIYRQT